MRIQLAYKLKLNFHDPSYAPYSLYGGSICIRNIYISKMALCVMVSRFGNLSYSIFRSRNNNPLKMERILRIIEIIGAAHNENIKSIVFINELTKSASHWD